MTKEIPIYHHRAEDCQAEQQPASNSCRQPASAALLVWILAYYVTCLIASKENHVTNTLTIFATHDLSSVLWVPGYLELWASSQFHPFWTCSFQSRCSWSCNFSFCDCRVWCNVGATDHGGCHEGIEGLQRPGHEDKLWSKCHATCLQLGVQISETGNDLELQ